MSSLSSTDPSSESLDNFPPMPTRHPIQSKTNKSAGSAGAHKVDPFRISDGGSGTTTVGFGSSISSAPGGAGAALATKPKAGKKKVSTKMETPGGPGEKKQPESAPPSETRAVCRKLFGGGGGGGEGGGEGNSDVGGAPPSTPPRRIAKPRLVPVTIPPTTTAATDTASPAVVAAAMTKFGTRWAVLLDCHKHFRVCVCGWGGCWGGGGVFWGVLVRLLITV
jgi:hypothetical protein